MQNSLATQKDSVRIGVSLLLSKLPNLLAGLIIFFSATQFGLHFWPPSSLVYGIRIDYLSPTIYFLDILILLYFAMRRLQGRRPEQCSSRDTEGGRSLLMGTLFPILLTNLLYSENPLATLSWSLHFLLYYLFLVVLRSTPRGLKAISKEPRGLQVVIPPILTLSLFFQTILALTQVFLGHSVGGLLYYFGERNVSVGSPGVALATFMDHVVLRAYGTFGHPNVLAGFAVISLLIILRLHPRPLGSDPLSKRTLLKRNSRLQVEKGPVATGRRVLMGTMFPLLLASLIVLLTQSRAAALSLFGFVIPLHLITKTKYRTLFIYFILGVAVSLVTSFYSPPRSDLSSTQRIDLQQLSLTVIKNYPIFGTGAQASISTYPLVDSTVRLLQPDHNSFTLLISWFGLFGVLAVFSAAKWSDLEGRAQPRDMQSAEGQTLKLLFPLLPLLFLDHYLFTSPQGLFILLLYLTIAVNYSHAQKNLQ